MHLGFLLSVLLGCRDPGAATPIPDGSATWTFGDGSPFDDTDTGACVTPLDADQDGWDADWAGGGDCDDNDAGRHPRAPDRPGDGVDADCDGADGTPLTGCIVTGPDVCDGVDNDCDGVVDDPYLSLVTTAPIVATRGPLLEDGGTALVVGIGAGGGTPDGRIEVYDAQGDLVVRIDGVDQSSSFGSQLATGRDLDGDGVVDLLVAAPFASVAGVPNRGRVFVFSGPLSATTTLADAHVLFEGGDYEGQAGGQLALLPDLNGDGLADVAIGDYRHALLLSGVPGPAVTTAYGIDRAWADLEWNTGGGPWWFASVPDEDGDGLPELATAVGTYDSGAGVVAVYGSTSLTGHLGLPDATWSLEGQPGSGLGASLTALDGALWSLVDEHPALVLGDVTLPLTATALTSAGDQDGDGREDLALTTSAGLIIAAQDATTPSASLAAAVTLQTSRASLPPEDDDGDGLPDLTVVTPTLAGILSGAALHGAPCNADGDGVTAGQGDCDDTRADIAPVSASEVCDGVDDDCDGDVDEGDTLPLGLLARQIRGLGDLDGDGTDELALLDPEGLVVAIDGETAPDGLAHVRFTLTGARDDIANVFAGAGDTDGNGFRELIVATPDGAWLVPAGEDGDIATIGASRFRDGTAWRGAGPVGSAGDVDGDGLDDPWLILRAPAGGYGLGVYTGVPSGTVDVDEAGVILTAPESWDQILVAQARPRSEAGSHGDMDGDGLDDLVVANPRSAYGDGRAYAFLGLPSGTATMDSVATLQLYGDPSEALGSTLAVGDWNGDGRADVALAGATGTRVLTGASCPLFAPRIPAAAKGLAFADLDGDGAEELYLADPDASWLGVAGGLIWRSAGPDDLAPFRAGAAGDALGAVLVGVGEVDDAVGSDLAYTRATAVERAGGACP